MKERERRVAANTRTQDGCDRTHSRSSDLTSPIFLLECNWRLRIYENESRPKHFNVSRRKVCNVVCVCVYRLAMSNTSLLVASSIFILSVVQLVRNSVIASRDNLVELFIDHEPIIWQAIAFDLDLNLHVFVLKIAGVSILLFIAWLALLLSGDVESNPGPGDKDPVNTEVEDSTISSPSSNSPQSPLASNRQAVVEEASSMSVPNHGRATSLKTCEVGDTASTPTSPQMSGTQHMSEADVDTIRLAGNYPASIQPEANTRNNSTRYTQIHKKSQKSQTQETIVSLRTDLLTMIKNWKDRDIWTDKKGFNEEFKANVAEYIPYGEEYYELVNKLYRRKVGSIICPLCLCRSTCKGGKSASHFIPQTMLKVFRDVHCRDEVKDFMYDISTADTLGIGLRCPDMLCTTCENVSSKEENKLRDIYVNVLAETECSILTFNNAGAWLQFILANIFFRGLLVGCDLKVEFLNTSFKEFFWILKKYCNKESAVLPDIRLYILANKPLNPNIMSYVHALDMLARNPRFTKLIQDKTGMLLYCQFDCFHLVAPLDQSSKAHFNQYQNGIGLDYDGKQQITKLRIPAPDESMKLYRFPVVLLQINAEYYSHFTPFVLTDQHRKRYKSSNDRTNLQSASKLTEDVVVFVNRAPDCPPKTYTPGTDPPRNTKEKHIYVNLTTNNILQQTESAFKHSPIAHYIRVEQNYAKQNQEVESDRKKILEKHNRVCRLLFMNELRHAIERRSRDSELIPPSIREIFDSVSKFGESDELIEIAKQIIRKTLIRRLSSVTVPWPDQSLTEIEQDYHKDSCGILFIQRELAIITLKYVPGLKILFRFFFGAQ